MRKTLAQAKNSSIPASLGIPACDPRFLQYLNEAQERLANKGKWWGTYKRIRVCVTAGCVTWPQEVLNVEALQVCKDGVVIRNEWFEFQEDVRAPATHCEDGEGACEGRQLLDRGLVYQYRDFTALSTVRVYPSLAADVGKRVLLQGLDGNGQPIRTLDSVSGNYVDGEYVTLASPFVETVNEFNVPGLTGAQKPLTSGSLTLTSVAVTDGTETQIAIWDPSVQNPEYRRTFLTHLPRPCNSGGCEDKGNGCAPADTSCSNIVVEAIVRLKPIPAVVDSDWLFIQNITALKYAMRSVQKEDANEDQEAEVNFQKAIRELRAELETYSPKDRTTVNVLPYGSAKLRYVTGGFI